MMRLSSRAARQGMGLRRKKAKGLSRLLATPMRRKMASAEHIIPPVMVRAPASGFLSRSGRTSKKVRRRYDVALSAPGARLSLPALPQVSFSWKMLSFALVLFFAGALIFAWTAPLYRINELEVRGFHRLSGQKVAAAVELTGLPIFMIDPRDAAQKIKDTFPEIVSVSLLVSLPNHVIISGTERTPVMIWHQNGRSDLVAADGWAFPLRDEELNAYASLPIIQAARFPAGWEPPKKAAEPQPLDARSTLLSLLDPQPTEEPTETAARRLLDPKMVAAVLQLASHLPPRTSIVYDYSRGLGWVDEHGWEVYFGEMEDIEMKFIVYKALVERFLTYNVIPALVSVEDVHAPYYRMER